MSSPLVYVIVLGWNHTDDSVECLQSVLDMDYGNFRALYVDNGSTDGAPDVIGAQFPAIEMIVNEENVGIAGGYNIGLEHALAQGADYAVVLNNDTALDRAFLSEMAAAAQRDSGAGMLVPRIYYYHDRSRIWSVGARRRRFPPAFSLIGLDQPDGPTFDVPRELEYAVSCALMFTRPALEVVGLFDRGYFFFYDDWDFCNRMRGAGYRIVYVPTARMWHKVSVSTLRSEKPAHWWAIWGRSSARYYLKYGRPWLASLAVDTLWFLARETAKGNARLMPAYLAGLAKGLRAERSSQS